MPAGFLSNNELITCLFVFFSKGCQGFFFGKINSYCTYGISFIYFDLNWKLCKRKEIQKFVKKFVYSKFVKPCDEIAIIPGLKYSFLTNSNLRFLLLYVLTCFCAKLYNLTCNIQYLWLSLKQTSYCLF